MKSCCAQADVMLSTLTRAAATNTTHEVLGTNIGFPPSTTWATSVLTRHHGHGSRTFSQHTRGTSIGLSSHAGETWTLAEVLSADGGGRGTRVVPSWQLRSSCRDSCTCPSASSTFASPLLPVLLGIPGFKVARQALAAGRVPGGLAARAAPVADAQPRH